MKRSDVKIPKNEICWVSYYNLKGELIFIMTSNQIRDCYYLNEVKDNKLKRIGKSPSPLELEEKFNVHEIMCS